MPRISEPILVGVAPPVDLGGFHKREAVELMVVFYGDAAGSLAAKVTTIGVGTADVTVSRVVSARASSGATPYLDKDAVVGGTGTTTLALVGNKLESFTEAGGMTQISISASITDPAGAVSYRIWLDVEDVGP